MQTMNNLFKQLLSDKQIKISETQLEQFYNYYRLLIDWNEKINLTAIIEIDEVYIKHFFDSLTLAIEFPEVIGNYKVIDIGSGAGFPGLPLKIIYPDLDITFLDSLNKRINFLKTVTEELGLTNCHFIHGRAEIIAHDKTHREQYDFALARAVAKLSVLNELCTPFIKVNGSFFALKGPDITEELLLADKSFATLNLEKSKISTLSLPNDYGHRNIIKIKKVNKTPKAYPRKAGTPAKNPL